jgi:endonuclease/exonuclease/phosphatase family metal-dependent hydrolase
MTQLNRRSRPWAAVALWQFAAIAALSAGGPLPGAADSAASCRTVVSSTGDASSHAVRWVFPDGTSERTSLDDWCTGVGPAVVAVDALPQDRAATSNELVVITWNVHAGGGDILALVEQLREGRLTSGRPVEHFVMLLQEAYRRGSLVPGEPRVGLRTARPVQPLRPGDRPLDIVDVAARLRLALFYVPSMRNGAPKETDEDRGNAILSTEPLSELSAIELPFERQRRVAVTATVQGRGQDGEPWRLLVTNAHLENRGGPRRLGVLSMVSRLRQVRHLLRETPASGPAVLAGDLNTWFGFGEPAYRALTKVFPGEARSDPRPTFGRLLRLDHMLFRVPDAWDHTTIRLDRFGSDHHPLLARIRIATEPAGLSQQR